MTYCDVMYLGLFLPFTMFMYSIVKQRHRPMVLLLASYLFFWSISKKLIVYVIISSFSIHYLGLWLSIIQEERKKLLKEAEKDQKKKIKEDYKKRQRKVLLLGVVINVGLLLVIKYTAFIGGNINSLFNAMHLPIKLQIPKYSLEMEIDKINFNLTDSIFYTII